jgi:type IV secretion system protein VirD4
VRALYDVIDLAPVTASSIRKTFTSRLDLWLNPILDAATAESDFDLRELRTIPLSIYVSVNPDDLHRLRPVLNLFFQQAIGLQTRELPERDPTLRHQVLMLLDEFTALGKIPIVAEAISYLPGYNVRVVLVIQTPAQLREVYGIHNAEVMLKSLGARIVFAPKDVSDAREISDELGFATVKARTVNKVASSPLDSGGGRSKSYNISDERRALLLPQEVKELGTEEAIVFYEGLRPIRCRKIRYFAERAFRSRLLPPPAHPAPPRRAASPPSPARVDAATAGPEGPPAAPTPSEGDSSGVDSNNGVGSKNKESVVIREATIADIERLESITLDDFATDFSRFRVPERQGRLSEAEVAALARDFVDTLRTQ